jgi:hypothetical protein
LRGLVRRGPLLCYEEGSIVTTDEDKVAVIIDYVTDDISLVTEDLTSEEQLAVLEAVGDWCQTGAQIKRTEMEG